MGRKGQYHKCWERGERKEKQRRQVGKRRKEKICLDADVASKC